MHQHAYTHTNTVHAYTGMNTNILSIVAPNAYEYIPYHDVCVPSVHLCMVGEQHQLMFVVECVSEHAIEMKNKHEIQRAAQAAMH